MKVKHAILLALAALLASLPASAQEVPRHPPILSPTPIEPVATALADRKDYAYVARIAWLQTSHVVDLTGTGQGPLGALESVLQQLYLSMSIGDVDKAEAYLNLAKKIVESLNSGDLQNLAMDYPMSIPACKMVYEDSVVYVISNPLEDPEQDKAPCVAPTHTIRVQSALDTILALLGAGNLTANTTYLLEFIHVPQEAAYPEIVRAILEGSLRISPETGLKNQGQANTSLVEALLEKVKTGSQEEAFQALQQLLEMARRGEIPYSVYAKALSIYDSRFGTPQQAGGEEEEVNLTQLVAQMDAIVQAAEKARAEAGIAGGGGGTPSVVAPRTIPQHVVYLAAAGLAAVAVSRSMRSRRLDFILPRAVLGLVPGDAGPEWCYRALVRMLSLRGFEKKPWETPREYLERVSPLLREEYRGILEVATEAYEASVYGGTPVQVDRDLCASVLRRLAQPWQRLSGG